MAPNYDERIDFKKLVDLDPVLKKLLIENGGLMNWKDEKHVLQLSKCLLKRDFGLSLDMPSDRLCPPIPGRYIRWIQELLDSTSDTFLDKYDPDRQVLGIDIGVGSSCIYALLGTADRPKWRFYGTDIDEKNFHYACKNVKDNNLSSRIRLIRTSSKDQLLPLDKLEIQHADFTMCNPPFYSSKEEMLATWDKDTPPSAVCTGAEIEMIVDGGDAGFVLRMATESKQYGERVQWYTTMLGKLSSVTTLVEKLKELGCMNWAIGCLIRGGKTRRWVVAWSWSDLRPRNEIARCHVANKDILPFPTECTIATHGRSKEVVAAKLNQLMQNLDIQWRWRQGIWAGIVIASENTWSRSARRKKQREAYASWNADDKMEIDGEHDISPGDDALDEEARLLVKISIGENDLLVRWLKGFDAVLFESFCGMLKRSFATD